MSRKLLGAVQSLWKSVAWAMRAAIIQRSAFRLLLSLTRRRPQNSGSIDDLNEDSDTTRLDDLDRPSTIPRQVDFGDIEQYEEIDDPI